MLVPAKRAQRIREQLGLKRNIPVKYGTVEKGFVIKPVDRNKAKRADIHGCIIQQCIRRHGYPALVALRHSAVVERDKGGKPVVNLYANDVYAYTTAIKFDRTGKGKDIEVKLRPFPHSWLPTARRKMAKRRMERMKDPSYKKRSYKPRRIKNHFGPKRATF
jgi:hypothetical protein